MGVRARVRDRRKWFRPLRYSLKALIRIPCSLLRPRRNVNRNDEMTTAISNMADTLKLKHEINT